jgi:phage shock protein A
VLVRIGCLPVVFRSRRRTPSIRIALAAGATLLASLALAVRAPATPLVEGAARGPEDLQEQVVRRFDQLDHVSWVIESVQADIAWVRVRISELSRQIGYRQRTLNRRAAEAYMIGSASGIDSMLSASSFSELQDAFEFLDAVSQRDHDVLLSLEHRKAELESQRVRLEALEEELRGSRERLEATVADLVEKLQRQQALLRRRAGETARDTSVGDAPSPPPFPDPSPPTSALGREAVMKLIRDRFASLGSGTAEVALCVAEAESGFDPLAVNSTTGAAGLFQFLPSTWASLSELAGRGAASVFDARANAAVAAWTVAHYGWHPWRSVAEDCRT